MTARLAPQSEIKEGTLGFAPPQSGIMNAGTDGADAAQLISENPARGCGINAGWMLEPQAARSSLWGSVRMGVMWLSKTTLTRLWGAEKATFSTCSGED